MEVAEGASGGVGEIRIIINTFILTVVFLNLDVIIYASINLPRPTNNRPSIFLPLHETVLNQ